MSGFVGILNLDGAPLDDGLLRGMTAWLSARGPDAQGVWTGRNIGLGHAMLRTTWEAEHEQQPCSLDGEVWIAADARVDGREELVGKLQARGRKPERGAPDSALILHAYAVWGEQCVEHIVGDFAFAIWDGPRRRLFCARDHFGVTQFFYARAGNSLIFSNTLNCLRRHPGVSDELNELAIADFLLFDWNEDPERTSFAGIQRIPPAHSLTCTDGQVTLRRYWQLSIPAEIHYKRSRDYVERFNELMGAAVKDRLRTDCVVVFMSGGLDSTCVASTACSVRDQPVALTAYTAVLDSLLPDTERYYSGIAAKALGIPIEYRAVDGYRPFDKCDEPGMRTPEPVHEPTWAIHHDGCQNAAATARVALTGHGGDSLLKFSVEYLRSSITGLHLGRLAGEMLRLWVWNRRVPKVGFRTLASGRGTPAPAPYPYPTWLNPDLEKRLDLRTRFKTLNQGPASRLDAHERALQNLRSSFWPTVFASYEAGFSGACLEFRHPFFDLRVVEYLLAIPPLPWSQEKTLLRQAMRKSMPDAVRLRPKTPLIASPLATSLKQFGLHAPPLGDDGLLGQFVCQNPALVLLQGESDQYWVDLRALTLGIWLRYSYRPA